MQLSRLFVAAGIVAWPLLMFSILSLTLIAERSLFWLRIWKRQDPLIQQVLKRLPTDWHAAIKLLHKNTDLPMARIFLAALELDRANSEEFRLALEGAAQAELPTLRRFGTVLDTIVAIAPLLGLLGTVLGLMAAFAGLGVGELAGSKAAVVTGGISEALSSTVLGLVVAILTMLFTNTFRGLYRRQVALIQEYGNRLELLYRRNQISDNR